MKAIIPVAGAGTRLRPHTYTQPKALIPVAGKPIMGFIVEQLIASGIEDFIFVVGYLGDKIKDFIKDSYPEINAEFVYQHDRKGSGHAVWLTRDFVNLKEPVFISLGDTIVDTEFKEIIDLPYSSLGVQKVSDPRQFGVALIGEEGRIVEVAEKPKIPRSNMALVGIYHIHETETLFECLDELIPEKPEDGVEYQLTDAIMKMIEKDVVFRRSLVGSWYDLGKTTVLLDTNATLLKKFEANEHQQAQLENSVIVPPVHIGANSKIVNSVIGPNMTIGENTTIRDSILKDSIIGSYSTIESISLTRTIIGSDASVIGSKRSLNIGDNTEINFSNQNQA